MYEEAPHVTNDRRTSGNHQVRSNRRHLGHPLEALRDTIIAALADDDGRAQTEAFAMDGEGYRIGIAVLSFEDMQRMAHPYTDEIAADRREDVLRPYQLPRSRM